VAILGFVDYFSMQQLLKFLKNEKIVYQSGECRLRQFIETLLPDTFEQGAANLTRLCHLSHLDPFPPSNQWSIVRCSLSSWLGFQVQLLDWMGLRGQRVFAQLWFWTCLAFGRAFSRRGPSPANRPFWMHCQLTEPVDANQKRSQNVAAVLIKLATEMHKKKMLHY